MKPVNPAFFRRRAPYGARGLKYTGCHGLPGVLEVAPRMGRVD